MVSRINDSRIGIRSTANGRIVQYPSRYADGGHWNRSNNPAPTTVFFGPGSCFFYTLPVGKARLDTLTRQELERVVMSSLSEAEVAELNTPRSVLRGEESLQQTTPQESQQELTVVQNEHFRFSIGQPFPQSFPQPSAEDTGQGGVVINDEEQNEQPVDNSLFSDILPN